MIVSKIFFFPFQNEMLVIAQQHANKIYRVSFLSLLPTYLSFHYGRYDIMLVPLTVFATSINYWRKPMYGWRRNMDIGAVLSGMCFQVYRVLECRNKLLVLTFMFSGTCCYVMSWSFYQQPKMSTYLHCGVHLCANMALVSLISGL